MASSLAGVSLNGPSVCLAWAVCRKPTRLQSRPPLLRALLQPRVSAVKLENGTRVRKKPLQPPLPHSAEHSCACMHAR